MNGLIFAYALNGKGGATALDAQHIENMKLPEGATSWVHLNGAEESTKTFLENPALGLDVHVKNALLADETRPQATMVGEGLLLNLRGVNLNENAQPEDMVSIRLWVTKSLVISVRRRKLKAVLDIEESLKQNIGPKTAGGLVCTLISRLFERMEPVLASLDDETDDVEEAVLTGVDATLRERIVTVRKQAILFRRYMAPQREALMFMKDTPHVLFSEKQTRVLHENFGRITRYVEDLDAIRERAQIVKDEIGNMLADRLNRNMYILSVIAAIFLPLGFLTGLLGINVGGIPGAENPNSFLIFCAILSVVVVLQVVIFRKMKWF